MRVMNRIRRHLRILLPVVAGALLLGAAAPAPGASSRDSRRVHVELVSEVASVQPGAPFWVAVRQPVKNPVTRAYGCTVKYT